MVRVFVYDGREFEDPNPKMSPDEVRQFETTFYPELANAEIKESKRGEDIIFEFKKRVGTKGVGTVEPTVPEEGPRCRLGYCVTKDHRYTGGNDDVFSKLQNGICPICEGPTDRPYYNK